jgi:hypothetical protein
VKVVTTDVGGPHAPGAMEVYLKRELPDGALIEFEQSPAGWLKKDGTPRLVDHRAYYVTEPGSEKRKRTVSVTTLIKDIIPVDLTRWGEEHGIRGTIEAFRRGELDVEHTDEDAVERVRALKLGADAARDRRATEGVNVHNLLEQWMVSETVPNPADHPPEVHGYIQALARWVMAVQPQVLAVERLVYSRTYGYAGRVDLLARIDGTVTLVDLKTQPRAGIYASAHIQAAMYALALEECGDEQPTAMRIVVLAEDGRFREMEVLATPETVGAALSWYREIKPIDSACASHNRVERDARRAA